MLGFSNNNLKPKVPIRKHKTSSRVYFYYNYNDDYYYSCLQGNSRFVFHLIRLKCVGRRILLCAVCAHHDVHADAAPPFVNIFYVLLHSVKKDHFQWAICQPLNVIEFWCEGNYSSLNLFALIWNFNEFFWVTEEMSI